MMATLQQILGKTLKEDYRYDLDQTRERYNKIGSTLFLGVGLVALAALLTVHWFDGKAIVYAYTCYCFVIPAIRKWRPPGLPLWYALTQLPLGITLIVSLQWIMPSDLVYLTGFLFPIVFIFAYEFHEKLFVRLLLATTIATTALLLIAKQLPYWPAYLITTFGSTIIIGNVVNAAAQRIQELANHDALTGLINRRYWEETLRNLVHLSDREQVPISVAFLDVDNFKRVNDDKGHAAGDKLLQNVATQMKLICRESDLVGRWGGDEFAIALPSTSKEQALALIKRLQRNLKQTSISAGIVTIRTNESIQELLKRADRAMYVTKRKRGAESK